MNDQSFVISCCVMPIMCQVMHMWWTWHWKRGQRRPMIHAKSCHDNNQFSQFSFGHPPRPEASRAGNGDRVQQPWRSMTTAAWAPAQPMPGTWAAWERRNTCGGARWTPTSTWKRRPASTTAARPRPARTHSVSTSAETAASSPSGSFRASHTSVTIRINKLYIMPKRILEDITWSIIYDSSWSLERLKRNLSCIRFKIYGHLIIEMSMKMDQERLDEKRNLDNCFAAESWLNFWTDLVTLDRHLMVCEWL